MMDESFWYFAEEAPDPRTADVIRQAETQPSQAPMKPPRGSQRPDAARRRKIKRSAEHAFGDVDWDEIYPQVKDTPIHRGIGLNLPDELHRYVHDPSIPKHQRAKALLNHIAGLNGPRGEGDQRLGLGMHWSMEPNIAESSAEKFGEHYAEANSNPDNAHDFQWGSNEGDFDYAKLRNHMHEHHGIHPHVQPASLEAQKKLHDTIHRGGDQIPGQMALFPEPPRASGPSNHLDKDFREPPTPKSKPGTAVVLHSPPVAREHIEENPWENYNRGGDVYHPFGHAEREIPIRSGVHLPISGISWKPVRTFEDMDVKWGPGGDEYTHHDFGKPEYREARKHATVLNTQVERLNKGDQVRTPTGQTMQVHQIRPHETDSTLMYLDTDQGTSTVKRGTDFQVVPANNQQQELPDIGNPMNTGNTGKLPMSGRTPGGPGAGETAQVSASTPCPSCGNLGTLHKHGDEYVCSVCGFAIAAGGSPGNLLFTNAPTGHMPPRRPPGPAPRAHVWGSRYQTYSTEGLGQVARRARQVLDDHEESM